MAAEGVTGKPGHVGKVAIIAAGFSESRSVLSLLCPRDLRRSMVISRMAASLSNLQSKEKVVVAMMSVLVIRRDSPVPAVVPGSIVPSVVRFNRPRPS